MADLELQVERKLLLNIEGDLDIESAKVKVVLPVCKDPLVFFKIFAQARGHTDGVEITQNVSEFYLTTDQLRELGTGILNMLDKLADIPVDE